VNGVESSGVLIVGGAVDGGRGGAGAENDGGLVGDDGFGPAGEGGFGWESEKSDSLDTAGLEDVGQLGVSLEKRIVCPELVDLVTERGGTVLESAKKRAEGMILFGDGLCNGEADEGKGAAVFFGRAGAELSHDEGDHGIGAVADFFGEGLDSASGGFADTGIVT